MSLPLFKETLSRQKGAWHFEGILKEQGLWPAAGVDEVGRGCLAGPVVAAAVILPCDLSAKGITDSKKLTASKREEYAALIKAQALSLAISEVGPEEIDETDILRASLKAMKKAIEALSTPPKAILVDGNQQIPISIPQITITKGDIRSCSIAAASIVAKVYRDKLMARYASVYPEYLFDKHKGYATKQHRLLLNRYGPCPIHRRSFRGVLLDEKNG